MRRIVPRICFRADDTDVRKIAIIQAEYGCDKSTAVRYLIRTNAMKRPKPIRTLDTPTPSFPLD